MAYYPGRGAHEGPWKVDKWFTSIWTMIPSIDGPHSRMPVRCAYPRQDVMQHVGRHHLWAGKNLTEAQQQLSVATVPRAREVCKGIHAPLKMLHFVDYVMAKAFVYGILALSKWLGPDLFRHGVHEWPPTVSNSDDGVLDKYTNCRVR